MFGSRPNGLALLSSPMRCDLGHSGFILPRPKPRFGRSGSPNRALAPSSFAGFGGQRRRGCVDGGFAVRQPLRRSMAAAGRDPGTGPVDPAAGFEAVAQRGPAPDDAAGPIGRVRPRRARSHQFAAGVDPPLFDGRPPGVDRRPAFSGALGRNALGAGTNHRARRLSAVGGAIEQRIRGAGRRSDDRRFPSPALKRSRPLKLK